MKIRYVLILLFVVYMVGYHNGMNHNEEHRINKIIEETGRWSPEYTR